MSEAKVPVAFHTQNEISLVIEQFLQEIARFFGPIPDLQADIVKTMGDQIKLNRESLMDAQRDGEQFMFVFKDSSYMLFTISEEEGITYETGMATVKKELLQ